MHILFIFCKRSLIVIHCEANKVCYHYHHHLAPKKLRLSWSQIRNDVETISTSETRSTMKRMKGLEWMTHSTFHTYNYQGVFTINAVSAII